MPPRRRPPAEESSDSSAARPSDEESSDISVLERRQRPPQRRGRRRRGQQQQPPEQPVAQRQRVPDAVPAAAAAAAAAAAQRPRGQLNVAAIPAGLPQDEHVVAAAANLGRRRHEAAHEIDPLRQILSRQGFLYLDDFELDELSKLAYILVKRQGFDLDPDPRPPEVQSEIDQHYQRNGADAGLSIHELNEYATTMDYIIKIKANIFGIRRLIRDNDARINITTMRDDDSGDEVLDVWAFLPPTLPYQVCQGTAMQHFSKYLCIFD